MNNNAFISLNTSGLGDKMLDILGFYVICKFLNYNPKIKFNNSQYYFDWGISNFDLRLFDFHNIELVDNDENTPFYIKAINSSSTMSPYKGYEFVSKFLPELSYETFSSYYSEYAKDVIRPSSIILEKIPHGLENSYGIHLRKSDKVNDNENLSHYISRTEFDIITQKIIEDITYIIQNEELPSFLIVSEDNNWKHEFKMIINKISAENDKTINIIDIDYGIGEFYMNYNGILDMFSLSKCKEILQGVKYSTFSMTASLLGKNKIRNYSRYLPTKDISLVHSWNSAIEINGEKNFDAEFHKKVTEGVQDIQTNINSYFTRAD